MQSNQVNKPDRPDVRQQAAIERAKKIIADRFAAQTSQAETVEPSKEDTKSETISVAQEPAKVAETPQETPTVEAKDETIVETKVEEKKEEIDSSKLAKFMQEQAKFRREQEAFKRQQEEFSKSQKQIEDERKARQTEEDALKSDPYGYIEKKYGASYDKWTQRKVSGSDKPTAEEIAQRALAELESFKQQNQEREQKEKQEREERERAERIKQWDGELTQVVQKPSDEKAEDKYELVRVFGWAPLAKDLIAAQYRATGEQLTNEEALIKLESKLEKLVLGEVIGSKKVQAALSKRKAPTATGGSGESKGGTGNSPQTLHGGLSTPPPAEKKKLTEAERLERAKARLREGS